MTVEKDITELSEEIFIRRYPEYVMNGEPLSPYYDLFASGYEIAIMEMRKRIAELEKENAELKEENEKLLDGDIEKHNKIVELEEENSRLKQIILGNEMEIAAKDETIEELKKTSSRILNKLFR